jgi:hypothetical protein
MRQDRFLTGIVIFIALLVILAVGLFFLRKGSEQAYGPEDTPEGVIRNYVLALQKADYARAYGYLAENTFQTSPEQYRQSMSNLAQAISDTSIQIETSQAVTPTEASVSLAIVQNSVGLFSTPARQDQTAYLVHQGGGWKVRSMPYPFWPYDLPQAPPPAKAVPAP